MCNLCDRVANIKDTPYLIKEFEHVYWVLGDHQYFKGYSLLLLKEHKGDLTELSEDEHLSIQKNLLQVSKFVKNHFNAKKTNQSCLGNFEPHLHWHIFPRYEEDLRDDATKNPWHCIDKFEAAMIVEAKALEITTHLREKFSQVSNG
jgi:diadenosine tetraphosphate (Ap4A) HIT family hydrolase